jgi:hypothetical protein
MDKLTFVVSPRISSETGARGEPHSLVAPASFLRRRPRACLRSLADGTVARRFYDEGGHRPTNEQVHEQLKALGVVS